MAKVCMFTGKKPSSGNNVSHSVRRTKRTFGINLQTKHLTNPETGERVKVRMTTAALRTMTKPLTARERRRALQSVQQSQTA